MNTLYTDICIVAAGPSGLAAAVTAAENGMRAIVLEKNAMVGGTANMGMGPFGVESRIQKAGMITLRKEEVFHQMMEYTHWRVDPRKLREYIWKSGSTIDWLEDMGVRFAGVAKYFPSAAPTWHVVAPEGGGKPGPRAASAMNKVLYENALSLGVQVLLNTPASSLIMEEGKAVGVKAKNTVTGEELEVRSKAVIVATGGFGDNPEMIRKECGYEWGKDIFNVRSPGVTGDGIRMVWEVGGAHGETHMEKIIWSEIPNCLLLDGFRQPTALVVNIDGQRVMDETMIENASVTANIIDRQPNRRIYPIVDNRLMRYYRKHGVDYPGGVHSGNPADDFEEGMADLIEQYPDFAFCADTVEELAEKIGIDPAALADTLEEYNTACEAKVDDLFCKSHHYLRPLKGKLYAVALCLGAYGSLGGIQVDYKFQVLSTENKPIPGLFASGSDTCDIYGDTYLFPLPGNTMGYAVNSGRLAAERATDYIAAMK